MSKSVSVKLVIPQRQYTTALCSKLALGCVVAYSMMVSSSDFNPVAVEESAANVGPWVQTPTLDCVWLDAVVAVLATT